MPPASASSEMRAAPRSRSCLRQTLRTIPQSTRPAGLPATIPAEWIYRPDPRRPVPPPAEVGGKAHHLARLGAAGAAVPAWIGLTPAAFDALAGAEDLPGPFRAAVIAAL